MISVSKNCDGFREDFGEGFEECEPATLLFGFFRFTMNRAPLLSYASLHNRRAPRFFRI